MKLNILLSVSAIYLAVLGIAFIFVPLAAGAGAVPADAPPALVAYLRMFGPPFLGIAILNWTARNAAPSAARNSIILGNIAGFGIGPWLDIWGLFGGARQLAVVFAVLHLLIALAFVHAWRNYKYAEPSLSNRN